ncbi:GNAT family N-acetyltransferase [Paenibacillus aceti]|uniref:BioF2-like acetyltransferase domain-containing protein n=1 Tax=Paenibacillus aceti TaxID=1820010 RepID=A0ABQ1VWX9_9BACL|nr:GNAT family N-acetyltransferase [Paenibacillus aceti]GGG00426.1 hypothetical protein GCM10010913_22740 [Paenibacillus aceti]
MGNFLQENEMLTRWAQFNQEKWRCTAEILKFQRPDSEAYIESLFFFNHKGKLFLPPLNPFHPTLFHPTPTDKPYRINEQWQQLALQMVDEIARNSGAASFILPPSITDIRPFLRRGFKASVRYTYQLSLPYSSEDASPKIRGRIKKANQTGYRTALTQNMSEVHPCLVATEERKGFQHDLTLEDLHLLQELLGESNFRCYVCYSPEGEAVSVHIVIIMGKDWSFIWVAGSKTAHLKNGVVQQCHHYAFEDLSQLGIESIDMAGANIASVAEAKSGWGGELVPYYQIRLPIFMETYRACRNWLTFNKKQKI